ncbi:3-hydroxyacyl-CoA dehydrogenase [Streptomyces sp. YKOK-I1]
MSRNEETTGAPAGEAEVLEYVRRAHRLAGLLPGLPEVGEHWRPGRAAVVGAGTMGGGIAVALANAGIPVVLVDRSGEDVRRGLAKIEDTYAVSVRRGRLEQAVADERTALITAADDLAAVADADMIVEAVFEDLPLKLEVFAGLDRYAKQDAVLGTNTSALDIDAIAAATSRPEQVIGTHFFSPANVMRLLEVIPGTKTAPLTEARVMALGRLLGKVPVRAGNQYGFIGNAMLIDYLREADFLVEEGAFPSEVDRVLKEFGLAMGPYTMGDMSGLAVLADVKRKEAAARAQDRRHSDLALLPVGLGRLGQKTGAGWYRYEENDRTPHRDPEMDRRIVEYSERIGVERRVIGDEEILKRCLYALVNRAAHLLEQRVATRPGDVDLVWVTGYGFPADKGGPLYWADRIGPAEVLADVQRLHEEHGAWWEPAPLLVRLGRTGATFASLDPLNSPDSPDSPAASADGASS